MIPLPRIPTGSSYDLGIQLQDAAVQMSYFPFSNLPAFYNPGKIEKAGNTLASSTDSVLTIVLAQLLENNGKKCTMVSEVETEKKDLAQRILNHEKLGTKEHAELIAFCQQLGVSLQYESSVDPPEHPFKHY